MMRSLLLAAAIGALTLAALPSARAWDPIGHMLVAQIAYDQLTPAAKAGVAAALARFNAKDTPHDAPYDPVTIACWMDDIRARTAPEFKQYAVWHYVNLPFTADGLPVPDASAGPNVILGIQTVEDILAGKTVNPAIDRDQAFVMLEHLVGDIHQPLHTTSRGEDAGGNKVKVANLKDPLADLIFTKGGNLHFFWDSSYRRVARNGFATVLYEAPIHDRATPVAGHTAFEPTIRAEATALEKKYPPAIVTEQGDALSWAKESHALGFAFAYGKLPATSGAQPVKLPADYVEAARDIAEKRIALAGYRLGALLNQYFATPAAAQATPTPSATPAASPTATPSATPARLILPAPATENPAG
jgi:hypothetical protein